MDVFVGMTDDQVHKRACSFEEALAEMADSKGQFDLELLAKFKTLINEMEGETNELV